MRTSRSSQRRTSRWLAAAACASLAVAPVAAITEPGRVAEMEVGKEGVVWLPVIEYETLLLTVSGPGIDLRRSFKSGDVPKLAARDAKLGRLPDGTYTYELRASMPVSPETRERLAAAREAMDRGERIDPRKLGLPGPAPSQSGHFTIREGALVSPGEREPGPRIEQTGDVAVDGSLKVRGAKSFVATDPSDGARELVYAALEGPEAGTYHRGTSRTVAGEVVIELPGHFGSVTEPRGLTVQLTPIGGWSRLYVAERSARRLVVRSADGADVEFDYFVQGVRRGYADFRVSRELAVPATDRDSEER